MKIGIFSHQVAWKNLPMILIWPYLVIVLGCTTNPTSTQEMQEISVREFDYVNFDIQHQSNARSCGAAVVASALSYWGINSTEKEILERHPPEHKLGYSLGHLRDILEANGLKAFTVPGNVNGLYMEIGKGRPVIIPIRLPFTSTNQLFGMTPWFLRTLLNRISPETNHFVVVVGLSDDEVMLADPADGVRIIGKQDLEMQWMSDGVMLVFARMNRE